MAVPVLVCSSSTKVAGIAFFTERNHERRNKMYLKGKFFQGENDFWRATHIRMFEKPATNAICTECQDVLVGQSPRIVFLNMANRQAHVAS